MDLVEHLECVGAGAIAAEDRVKRALVNDGVKAAILELKHAHVHLPVDHVWVALPVMLSHLLLHSEGDINVLHILVAIIEHLLGEARVSSADVQDIVSRLNIQVDNFLEARVALIPIKLLLVFLVTVLPVLLLSVLRHFLLFN